MSKYGNQKTVIDGMVFDSKHEALRWCELRYMERAKLIKDLCRQVSFTLIPVQKDSTGKVIERACKYVADFVYVNTATNQTVVEDAKGMKTDVYKIKKKLMLEKYGIEIKEV